MKLEFKPEMFDEVFGGLKCLEAKKCADIANKRLAEMLLSATVVWGSSKKMFNPTTNKTIFDTHKALLINIEPIVKEPCKHEPFQFDPEKPQLGIGVTNNRCRFCNVALVAEWKAK